MVITSNCIRVKERDFCIYMLDRPGLRQSVQHAIYGNHVLCALFVHVAAYRC